MLVGAIVAFFLYRQNEKEDAAAKLYPAWRCRNWAARAGARRRATAYLKVAAEYPGIQRRGAGAVAGARAACSRRASIPRPRLQFESFTREYGDSPFMGEALLGSAACLDAQGKTNEALTAYNDLVGHHPGDNVVPQARFALGRLYEAQNDPEKARNQFEEVARANPYGSLGSEAGMRVEELKVKYPKLVPPTPPADQHGAHDDREAMKLTIIGTGYVGLVTGACFAEVGHHVVCVDNDAAKVKVLQEGGIPIYEPGLEELVKKNTAAGPPQLHHEHRAKAWRNRMWSSSPCPTPPLADGSVDMSFIEKVARDIAGAMTSYKIVVDKSTVPVKTGDKVAETIKRYSKAHVDFDVVSNPEFLREGFAVEDLMRPGPRGHRRALAAARAGDEGDLCPVQRPDHRHGHQLGGADQARVQLLPRAQDFLHQRHLRAVRGDGRQRAGGGQRHGHGRAHWPAVPAMPRWASAGAAFPRTSAPSSRSPSRSAAISGCLKEVQQINAGQMDRFVKKISDTLWVLKDKTIGVLGLAFKQNTDDIRMSPAIELCQRLQKEGARPARARPQGHGEGQGRAQGRHVRGGHERGGRGMRRAGHRHGVGEFKKLDLERARKALTHPIMFDGRNLFDPAEMERLGFIYKSIGR